MKHKVVYVYFLVMFLSTKTSAQLFTNNFKINALSPFYNALNVSYEKLLKDHSHSIQIGANYMDFKGNLFNPNPDFESEKVVGGVLTFEYRNRFDKEGFNNFYIAPFARAMYYKRNAVYLDYINNNNFYSANKVQEKSNYASIGIGATVGKQFVFSDRFTLDLFLGPVWQFLVYESRNAYDLSTQTNVAEVQKETLLSERIPNKYLSGYGLRAGVNIGILF